MIFFTSNCTKYAFHMECIFTAVWNSSLYSNKICANSSSRAIFLTSRINQLRMKHQGHLSFLKIQQRSSISAVECRPYFIPCICFRCAFHRCFTCNWNSMELLSFSHPNCELFATDFVHGSQFIYQCIKKTLELLPENIHFCSAAMRLSLTSWLWW